MNPIFCDRLKTLRENRGKTQEDMANVLGVKRPTYGGYERGTITPPTDKTEKLAEYFQVSVDYLVGNTNDTSRGDAQAIDLAKLVGDILYYITDYNQELLLDGELVCLDAREALLSGIESSLKTARLLNRRQG